MPKVESEKDKRLIRRKNHIAKDLWTPKYRARAVPQAKSEDEDERRFRRYGVSIEDEGY